MEASGGWGQLRFYDAYSMSARSVEPAEPVPHVYELALGVEYNRNNIVQYPRCLSREPILMASLAPKGFQEPCGKEYGPITRGS